MSAKSIILWAILIIVPAACAYWHYRENKKITSQWHTILAGDSAKWVKRFAWSRTLQLISVLLCYTLLLIIYDWQLNDVRQNIVAFETAKAEAELQVAQQSLAPAITPAELPQENGGVAVQSNPVLDIYNPEERDTGNQSVLDNLKKRYEEILVTHFFMKKCNFATPVDYHIIISALSQEMASVNAPGRLQHDIVTAARGSYQEMYSKTDCNIESMPALQAQYSDYISSLSKNFVAP